MRVSCSHGPRAAVRGSCAVREPHDVCEPHGPRKSCVVVREPRAVREPCEPRGSRAVVREPHGPREPRAVARCIDSYWGLDGADSFPILNT